MTTPVVATILFGLAIGTILYFVFGNNAQRIEENYYYEHPTNENCSICLELLSEQSVCTLKCGHEFHLKCIESWRRVCTSTNQRCPLCRCKC